MISSVRMVWLPVRDMPAAVTFYRDTLGLEVDEHDGDWVEVSIGDARLGLNANESPDGDGGAMIAFGVDGELEATVEELRNRGVEFPGEVSDHPWGRIATFRDPSGNDLQLYAPPR